MGIPWDSSTTQWVADSKVSHGASGKKANSAHQTKSLESFSAEADIVFLGTFYEVLACMEKHELAA